MKLLILTSGKANEKESTETRLQDELIRRGHDVSLIDVDKLEKQEISSGSHHVPKQSLFQKFFSNHQAFRAEHILVPALKNHLRSHYYDAILPTHIYAAEVASATMQSEENMTPLLALVSTENDSMPRKASLSCDEYIVMSKHAISTIVDWGINADRIHLIEASDHTIHELCDLIESLV